MNSVDELHGVKVYFDLTTEQRLDVQLISNTNISISSDLIDRMRETAMGPELRDWCQAVGLLDPGTDFSDKRQRGGAIPVALARAFIQNFLDGKKPDLAKFDATETTPVVSVDLDAWTALRHQKAIWQDAQLKEAGKQFATLIKAQRKAFDNAQPRPKPDYPEKATNMAIVTGWAYVAGALVANPERLKRHYSLAQIAGSDPLRAETLANGKHKTDAQNYRGLGYRTDAKERGRFVELFYLQAEHGKWINKALVEAAIQSYHAKQAALVAMKAREKAANG